MLLVASSLIATSNNAQDSKQLSLGGPPTVEELVAKNVEAKGGADALRALKSVRLKGKLLVNQGQIEFSYVTTKKRPNEVRTEATLQGMTQVQAYDGTQGWKISPFGGRKDPEKMSADEAKSLVEDAEIDGPLVDWQAKGSNGRLSRDRGRGRHAGAQAEGGAQEWRRELRLSRSGLFPRDPNHRPSAMEQGAQVEVETDLGDYEKIDGVFFPFSIEAGPKGSTDKQKIIIEKGEANVPVDDAIFKFPNARIQITSMRFLNFVLFSVLCLAGVAIGAEQAPYNSATISGLGARNIGSATMSGRVSAIAATREPSGQTDDFRRRGQRRRLEIRRWRDALQAGLRRAAGAIDRRDRARSRRTRRTSGSGRANRGRATAFRSATASTNPTDGGETWTHVGPAKLGTDRDKSSLVRQAATPFMPPCRARSGAIRQIAVSTRRPTAARLGTSILKGRKPFHRRLDDRDGSDQSEQDVRRPVGFSAQRLDVPLRRRRP